MIATRYSKPARLLWIAMYMQRKREFTTRDIRRELGISRRTMMRYVAALREAGFMIDYSRDNWHGACWKYYCWDAELSSAREMVG